MRFKKIFFIIIAFISVFFYGSSKDIESIHSVSSKKTAELNLKVTKKKSIEEPMYIDRDKKKIFYFFGDEGLVKNDSINITEKLSMQDGKSKTFSKHTNNTSEVRIVDRSQDGNIDYIAERGDIKNRVVVNYKNEPKNIYVEFYEGIGKLKKVIKNRYITLTRKKIYGKFDKEKQEIIVDFVKNGVNLGDVLNSNEKLEIIGVSSNGTVNILEHENLNIEQVENNVQGRLKIKLKNFDDEFYLIVYDSFSNLKEMFILELENEIPSSVFNKSSEIFKENFKWNAPIIDITEWTRKASRIRVQNKDFYYGEESFLGDVIPYIDINMGEIIIPEGDSSIVGESIELKSHTDEKNRGKIFLKNKNGEFIEGVLYFKSDLAVSSISEVKGRDNLPIEGATSKIIYRDLINKKIDVRLRIYDRKLEEESIFINGLTEYISSRVSDNTIEIKYESNILYADNTIPPVEFYDTRDTLKEVLKINKRLLDFTYEAGENVGKDLSWVLANRFIDVRLAEVAIQDFEDKVSKLKDPYIEIDTQNDIPTGHLEIGEEKIKPYRYYIRLESGKGLEKDKISEGALTLGYGKISTSISNERINELKGDIIVRLLREDYLTIKHSGENTLNFKNSDDSIPKIRLVLNSDYPDRICEINLDSYNIVTLEEEKAGKTVDLKVLIALNELKENKLNLVFDMRNNMSGDINIKENGQNIESELTKLNGLSVFDMSGEPVSQSYKKTDILSMTSSSGDIILGDTGASFDVDGYRGMKFKQPTTNIVYEVKFWNNTKKIEIVVDKTHVIAGVDQESIVNIGVLDKDGNSKLNLNLTLNASLIDETTPYMRLYPTESLTTGAVLQVGSVYTHSSEWNAEVTTVEAGLQVSPAANVSSIDIGVDLKIPTYSGDSTYVQIRSVIGYGLTENNFYLEQPLNHVIGQVRNGKLYLDDSGKGRARIRGILTKENVETIWRNAQDYYRPKIYAYEIVVGNGKRKIPQYMIVDSTRGGVAVHVELESEITNINERFKIGAYYVKNQTAKIYDENDSIYVSLNNNGGNQDYPGLIARNFKGKEIDVRFEVRESGVGNTTNYISMLLNDIVLIKKDELFGIFRTERPDAGGQDRNKHTLIMPRYSPKAEAYSSSSTLQTLSNDSAKILTDKLEITRIDLNDSSTTYSIVKDLGTVGLLGRDTVREYVMQRNSTTMNSIKLPNRAILQKIGSKSGKSDIAVDLSFSATNTNEKDFLQIATIDQDKKIYMHISKSEAEKLEPNKMYSLVGLYDGGRVDEVDIENDSNIAYIGLKTDNTAQMGLNEYIYEPLFKLNIQTVIAEDTSVEIRMGENKPLIKSNGDSNLVRVYLSDAKYSVDITNPENYSSLRMKGLLRPNEYDNPEYGATHNMVVTVEGKTETITIPLSSTTGGQGVLKTTAGDLYIGYLNDSNLISGITARNPLEVLTFGIKEYKFQEESLKINIEHRSSDNPNETLFKESFTLEVPKFLPKRWYYNAEDNLKMEEEATGSPRYVDGNKMIYPLGNVSLSGNVDLEITKNASDLLGVRIEYDEDIELENKNNSSNKIQGKIARIDSSGNILSKESIYTTAFRLAVVVDTTQSNYSTGMTYVYKNGNVGEVSSTIRNKIIRIGREDHWEGLIKSIELKRVSQGEFALNYNADYLRGTVMEFDESGVSSPELGAHLNVNGEFFKGVPDAGKVVIFKYENESNLYGEKLGEVNIVGGQLETPLEFRYGSGMETVYSITLNKVEDNLINMTLNYWQDEIINNRVVIRVEDKNGVVGIYKMDVRNIDNTSLLTIGYDNSQMEGSVLPGELANSLYFGSILNPSSFNYNDQRANIESLNKLKVSYYGKNLNMHDTIGRIEVGDKNIILTDNMNNEIVIEDTSIYRVYKREVMTSEGDVLFEEGFKLRGYFNPRTTAEVIDGRYKGTLRVNIEIY